MHGWAAARAAAARAMFDVRGKVGRQRRLPRIRWLPLATAGHRLLPIENMAAR